jgi:hypothetical protein
MRQLGQVPCLLARLQARVTSAKLKERAKNQAISRPLFSVAGMKIVSLYFHHPNLRDCN